MNSNSSEYLAFNIGYPNAFDRSLGRTGSFLMVHGGCRSVGCYAMTDYQMEEIYGLVDEAFKGGQDRIQLAALPFRMTTQNWTRHADNSNAPFWEMLKSGDDAFFATRQPPSVAVCDQRYVFNPGVAIISIQALLARPALQLTLPTYDGRLLNCPDRFRTHRAPLAALTA